MVANNMRKFYEVIFDISSLMFSVAMVLIFALYYLITDYIFKKEKRPKTEIDKMVDLM